MKLLKTTVSVLFAVILLFSSVTPAFAEKEKPTLLITGGGALNVFLIERIKELSGAEVVIPDKKIIEYKEAIIFALLGALYMADEPSCLSAVTGAPFDNIGGMLFKI